jgi:hypothetical protein
MDKAALDEALALLAWRRAKGTGRDIAAMEILRGCKPAGCVDITAPIVVVDLISPKTLTEPSPGEMFSPRWDLISTD